MALDKRESELHSQMAAQAADHEAVIRLDRQLHEVRAEKESVEEAWLLLSDEV
jgi:ATP-binding cassette subfamily F protein uup